jgi:glycosyltransferase involved in cell wall biosynthesis
MSTDVGTSTTPAPQPAAEAPAPGDLPLVSVVIPVYNDARRLSLCLKAILDQDYPAGRFEVIVVDNNSDQQQHPTLPEDERFRLLHETRRGSYAARNTGVEHSRGEVLAFTDSDCIPRRDWLSRGVAALGAPQVDAVGGAIQIFFDHGPEPVSGPEHFEALNEFLQRKYVEEWSFAATANLFVGREALEEVGAFDVRLQSGGDLDFGTRLGQAGRRLVYDADTIVEHPARSTWRELAAKTVRVAGGIADRSAHLGRRHSVRLAVGEARGGVGIWVRVWDGSRPAPRRPLAKIRYAATFSAVRALRTGVHLGRALRPR